MRTTRLAALSLLAASVAFISPSAASATPSQTSNSSVAHVAADSTAAQSHVTSSWTGERMKSAASLDLPQVSKDDISADVEVGAPSSVEPTDNPQAGGPWDGKGDIVKTSGRVFFSFDGKDASCSGDAVTSDNGSVVLTAGHCVKYQGSWHTDWVFVPGYHDGEAPYGEWAASKTLTTPQWEADEDMNYDVGTAVVGQVDGKNLTDVVGGQGVSFNGEYNQDMYSFGFPAEDPYDGETLDYCSGPTTKDTLLTTDHGLPCNMTGGSSGGPWFVDFDESTGTGKQASVNSFGYQFLPDTMFGPYFGDEAKTLYDTAAAS